MEWENRELFDEHINELIRAAGGRDRTYESSLVRQMITTCLKMLRDDHDVAQMKLISRALKEMRYAYHVFNQHIKGDCLSIFGSARTPEDHPDYIIARDFSRKMTQLDWMCITGAADGIMKAGHEGGDKESNIGLSIRLAFESGANPFIEGDPKLINFRYFFTRKLMFMSHSKAAAFFPGGFGTNDELYELLTLIQTGKAPIVPIVLLEGEGGVYWHYWDKYVRKDLLESGWISAEDLNLYYLAPDVVSACDHIEKFYHRFHSSRYVDDLFVMRMKTPISKAELAQVNVQFKHLLTKGEFVQGEALPEEEEVLDMTRLVFYFNRRDVGGLRLLIDHLNSIP